MAVPPEWSRSNRPRSPGPAAGRSPVLVSASISLSPPFGPIDLAARSLPRIAGHPSRAILRKSKRDLPVFVELGRQPRFVRAGPHLHLARGRGCRPSARGQKKSSGERPALPPGLFGDQPAPGPSPSRLYRLDRPFRPFFNGSNSATSSCRWKPPIASGQKLQRHRTGSSRFFPPKRDPPLFVASCRRSARSATNARQDRGCRRRSAFQETIARRKGGARRPASPQVERGEQPPALRSVSPLAWEAFRPGPVRPISAAISVPQKRWLRLDS